MVDGQPESRKTAKIRAGQTVECRGAKSRRNGVMPGPRRSGMQRNKGMTWKPRSRK